MIRRWPARRLPLRWLPPRWLPLRWLPLVIPWVWFALFLLVPLAIVVKISLAEALVAIPPYGELLARVEGRLQVMATLENYVFVFTDGLYARALLSSLRIAATATLCCLLIGYPLAWAITQASPGTRNVLLLLVVLPSWTSFLIRVYAWMGLLGNTGYLNQMLMALGVVNGPVQLLRTDFAVYVGIVYTYLPFMVLPLYTSLARLDRALVEAALDLGATPWRCFRQVVLPLTRPGIAAGTLLVFIPATGEFVIPELLGGADTLMIGRVLWEEFFNNRDWPLAAALAVVLLVLLAAPIVLFTRQQLPPAAGSPGPGRAAAPEGGGP